MTRVCKISIVLALFSPVFLGHALANQAETLAGQKPNIVFILTDDQGKGQLSCEGHPWLETPHIDQLFRESTYFSDFHMSPTCTPSRAAIMTGNYPFRNGTTHTGGARARMTLNAKTLPQFLKNAGYTTGIFGKWHLGYEDAYQPQSRGFDEVFIHGYGGIGQKMDVPDNKYLDPIIRHNGSFVKTQGFCTDVFFGQALDWIHEQRSRPFFAFISTNAPHGPYIAPEDKRQKFHGYGFGAADAGFYGMIENIDDNEGRPMAKLKDWHLDENTLVIFMSDNGFASLVTNPKKLGTRDGVGLFASQANLRGFKKTPYEGGTQVPAFFRWKGALTPGREISGLSAHIDLLPTLLEIAGTEVPQVLDGRSLLPLMQNPEGKWSDRHIFFHIGRWGFNTKPDEAKYDKRPGKAGFAVRNARFRLVNHAELYDIQNDPSEKLNVAKQFPETVKEMQSAYDQWWDEVRPFMINEGRQRMEPNPFHQNYQRQLENDGIPVMPKSEW